MAATAVAAGVLGVAGWGIWRRSQVVGAEADALPLPPELELISRGWVRDQINAGLGPDKPFVGFGELAGFIEATSWADGTTSLSPDQEDQVADIFGAIWPYTRLIQASSLNLMCLVNSAHARAQSPPIPNRKIGSAASPFNLERSTPLQARPEPVKAAVEQVKVYLRTKVPVPDTAPK